MDLDFNCSSNEEKKHKFLASLLSSIVTLKNLALKFPLVVPKDANSTTKLSHFLPVAITLVSLHSLSLESIVTSEECLRALLLRHSSSLRKLQIPWFEFREDEGSGGSWIDFIIFVHENLRLEKVRFTGPLSNGADKSWQTWDYEMPKDISSTDKVLLRSIAAPDDCDENCLKYKIERFISHRGQCPFTPRRGDRDSIPESSSHRHDLPWNFDGDA